jgi:hypothetical protein
MSARGSAIRSSDDSLASIRWATSAMSTELFVRTKILLTARRLSMDEGDQPHRGDPGDDRHEQNGPGHSVIPGIAG